MAWVTLCIEYQFQGSASWLFEPDPTKPDHAGLVLKLLGSLTTLKPVSTYLLYQLEWMISIFVLLILLILFWPELLHCIPSNKLVVVCTGGQISVVQALLEELPGQFLTYMRSRDIKPHPLHVAPTFAWVHLPSPQDVDIMQILLTTSTEFFWVWTTNWMTCSKGALYFIFFLFFPCIARSFRF